MLSYERTQLYKYAAFFVVYEVSTYLANDMIMPGMIKVVHEFQVPVAYAATSLSYFILGGCLLPVILSFIGDRFGLRRVLLTGNAFFILTTVWIPFTRTIDQFLLARFFQGMGLGFIFIGYASVHSLFDDVAAIKLTAWLGNISLLAPLIGPLLGGAITNSFNWRYVFIVVAILSLISWRGLYRYMPSQIPQQGQKQWRYLLQQYRDLLTSKLFVCGTLVNSCNGIVMISWIGLSPVIVLDSYHQPFAVYARYQLLVFSGTALSSMLIQLLANEHNLLRLIRIGSKLALAGLSVSFILSFINHFGAVLGIFMFTLGSGLYSGIVNRLVIAAWQDYASPISALNSIIYALVSVVGLEASNFICSVLGYSLPSLAIINLLLGLTIKSLTNYFIKILPPRPVFVD